jgi:hypothetical protein
LIVGMDTVAAAAAAQTLGHDSHAPPAGRVCGIRTTDMEVLRDEVPQRLTVRCASGKGFSVTAAEQRAYAQRVRAALRKDHEQHVARRDTPNRRPGAGNLPAVERRKLASERGSKQPAEAFKSHWGSERQPAAGSR